MPTERRPDDKLFGQMRQHYEQVYREHESRMPRVEDYVDGSYLVWPTKELREARGNFKSPRASNIILHAVNAQSTYEPRFHREPVGIGKGHEKAANRVEAGLTEVMGATTTHSTWPTYKNLYRNFFTYGRAVVFTHADLSDRKPQPVRKANEAKDAFDRRTEQWERNKRYYNPVRIESVHPKKVWMEPGEKNPPVAIYRDRKLARDIEDLSIKKAARGLRGRIFTTGRLASNDPYEQLDLFQLWSDEWHQVYLDDLLLYEEPNEWGYQPLAHAFSGYGYELSGEDGNDPANLAKGLITGPLMDVILIDTQQMNARHHVFMRAAHAKFRTSLEYENAQQLRNEMSREGGIATGVRDEEVGYIPYPEVPAWLFQEAQGNDRLIQEATFNRITQGEKPTGVDRVGTTAILDNNADRAFNDPRMQMRELIEISAQHTMRLVESLQPVLEGPIRVGKHSLDAKDIMGDYNVSARMENVDPVLAMQEAQLALQEYGAQPKLISRKRYFAIRRVDDDTAEEDEILLDELVQRPEVHEELIAEAAEHQGFRKAAARIRANLAAQKAQEAEQAMTGDPLEDLATLPSESGVALPGSPQESAQAARQLRAPIGGVNGRTAKPAPRGN